MGKLDVRIVQLEPMHVASALGYGESPEPIAWDKILAWAKEKGLLDDLEAVRFFGFNNPNPSPGSPNYGYEQWITLSPAVVAELEEGAAMPCSTVGEGCVELKAFSGGLYAVTRCEGIPQIGNKWKQLVAWFEDSGYKKGHHQWLEECFTPPLDPEMPLEDYAFDLYLPITE